MTVRRLKTYTGSQGYVYQYYFVGQRAADGSGSPATEFIFDVTSDRKTTYAVSVVLPQQVVSGWNQVHGRALTDSEQYAAAKLRLFRAFDELENAQMQGLRFHIDLPFLEESLAGLGVE
jgi:hypothetical protein